MSLKAVSIDYWGSESAALGCGKMMQDPRQLSTGNWMQNIPDALDEAVPHQARTARSAGTSH